MVKPETLEKIFIKTIFHKEIDSLWNQIKTLHFEPEKMWDCGFAPRLNLLLYGPPGTGKSTFAWRVAMATGRHIINVRLNDYSKDELLKIFIHPVVGGKTIHSKDVIYVLDEFDIDINKILMKSICKEKQLQKLEGIVNKFFDGVINNMTRYKHSRADLDKKKDEPKKDEPNKDETKKDETKKDETIDTSGITAEIDNINKTLAGMTTTFDNVNKIGGNIIKIEDLLTIFQGAVPTEGCVIIAMTNKYEELKEKCPALFRPGRLTPVYFGNFDLELLSRVSKHYFNRNILFDAPKETEIEISPSHVMEIVSQSMLCQNLKYEYFIDKIQKNISVKISPDDTIGNILKNNTHFKLIYYDDIPISCQTNSNPDIYQNLLYHIFKGMVTLCYDNSKNKACWIDVSNALRNTATLEKIHASSIYGTSCSCQASGCEFLLIPQNHPRITIKYISPPSGSSPGVCDIHIM